GGLTADTNSLFITTALIADANFDATVDASDFTLLYNHLLEHSFSATHGDFNHDGGIDGLDFDLWFTAAGSMAQPILNTFGQDATTLSALRATPVPEPASLVLLLPSLLLFTRRRRNADILSASPQGTPISQLASSS